LWKRMRDVVPSACLLDCFTQALLQEVGLGYLLQRPGGLLAVEDWADSLSLGEQQRLAFARLFCHSPAFAIIDEGTSALDVALEEHCLRRCISRGIGMVSVGHRPTLIPFHTHMLTLQRHGKYVCSLLRHAHVLHH
jgi:ABC-type uncharacterized transport system fused permease/ATPase subunit